MDRFYVETFGCQMNVADSVEMGRRLRARGYRPTSLIDEATIVLVNTCTVREHAEHRALSFLGRLADWKAGRPDRRIVFAGCAAERLKETLARRFPQVDAIVGAKSIGEFDRALEKRVPLFDGKNEWLDAWGWNPHESSLGEDGGATAFVTIMRGCNFSCSYCIVPSVRGRELYRPAASIHSEITERIIRGSGEVLLLGQTVNSYRPLGSNPDPGGKEISNFADLLEMVEDMPGVGRIRFMSPHPFYLDESFARRYGSMRKAAPHIHLPVQSGSNRILAKMRRNYTREDFLRRVESLRRSRPGLAVTTDFIVGFPGETEEDFEASLRLGAEGNLDGAYIFKYSSRPGTESAQLSELISERVKEERLARLLEETDRRSRAQLARLVGEQQEVLVETCRTLETGFEMEGRTPHSRKIYVRGKRAFPSGAFLMARVENVDGKTLFGGMVE